jgi:hypothetical protein
MTTPTLDYKPAGLWTPAELDALVGADEPRVATPMASQRSHGRVLSAFDDLFGFDLMPWQAIAADRGMAVRPDGSWCHATVTIVVARQNGKTTLAARRILAGLFVLDDRQLLHLAQDRALPRQVFTEVADLISESPELHRYLKPRGGIRTANGTEAITLKDGSTYRILAPTESAVRGYGYKQPVGFILFDEVRTHESDAVWSAVQYTQRAHPNPTRWAISNAGNPDSVVLNGLRDRGRAAAQDPGTDPEVCYLEWSTPDDVQPDDPTGWVWSNPALGRTLRGTSLLEELRSDDPDNFRTEALCQWVNTVTAQAIPWELWEACADRNLPPVDPGADVRTWWAVDLDTERRHAALVMAAEVDDRLVVGLHRQWTADEVDEDAIATDIAQLWEGWGPVAIGYDPATCSGLVDRQPGLPWEKVTGVDWVISCSQLLDAVQTQHLVHSDQPDLNAQLSVAGRRDYGDGSWRISRKDSSHPIPAVVALARAVHLSTMAGGVGITVL